MKRTVFLFAVLVLGGCGSSSGSGASTSVSQPSSSDTTTTATSTTTGAAKTSGLAAGGTIKVTMKNLTFAPKAINVKVGDRIVFVNDDTPPHNVTWVSGPKFNASPTLDRGAKFTVSFSQPGVVHYYCSIHPFMKGTILVTR